MSRYSTEWVYRAAARFLARGDDVPLRHEPGVHDQGGVRRAHREGPLEARAGSRSTACGRVVHVSANERAWAAAMAPRPYAVLSMHSNSNPPATERRRGSEGLAARTRRGLCAGTCRQEGIDRHRRRRFGVRRAALEPAVAQPLRPADQGGRRVAAGRGARGHPRERPRPPGPRRGCADGDDLLEHRAARLGESCRSDAAARCCTAIPRRITVDAGGPPRSTVLRKASRRAMPERAVRGSPMRIAFFNDVAADRRRRALGAAACRGLAAMGHQVTVVCPWRSELYRSVPRRRHRCRSRTCGCPASRSTSRCSTRLRKREIDVLLLHGDRHVL